MLSYLKQRLQAIDRDVEVYGSKTKEALPKPKLEDHKEILELLQKLIGEAHNELDRLPERTCERINEIPAILQRYGIAVAFYQPDEPDETRESKFDIRVSSKQDRTEAITLKPALVKGDEVLLRGSAVEPATAVR